MICFRKRLFETLPSQGELRFRDRGRSLELKIEDFPDIWEFLASFDPIKEESYS
jgi:hypothetical protein